MVLGVWVERKEFIKSNRGSGYDKMHSCVSGDVTVNTLFCAVTDTLLNDGGESV